MAIVPSGKTRVMVAQNFSNPLSEGFDGKTISDEESGPMSLDQSQDIGQGSLETGGALEEDINENANQTPEVPGVDGNESIINKEEDGSAEKSNSDRKTLASYVFDKLQNYGYPGRRLQDFKSEFVKETISPDGVKDIQVIIPDKKYPNKEGITDIIENEELKEISQEVNKMFGLNFNGAERSNEKWTIKFTSADLSSPDEESENNIADSLDKVYGKPEKNSKPSKKDKKPKVAFTIREMIKTQKDELITKIKKNFGE